MWNEINRISKIKFKGGVEGVPLYKNQLLSPNFIPNYH